MNWLKSMGIAFAMYSKIPMPKLTWTKENMQYALCFFPFVGLAEGILLFAAWKLLHSIGFGSLFCTAILSVIPVLVTGGIHVDGFLDTMDALSSYQPRERKLEILKDSHTGAFAIIGGIIYFLLYFGGMSELSSERLCLLVSCGFFLSRTLSGLSLVFFQGAKKDGMAYAFVSAAHKKATRVVLVMEFILSILLMCLFDWKVGMIMVMGALCVFLYYRRMAYREFGGITGDLAGFFLQICELVLLYSAVIAGRLG